MIATSILFLIISPLGILATLVPLYWHLEAGNVGTCMYMIWTALMLCIELVGAVVWNGNALDWAPVYCDISAFAYSPTRFLPLTIHIQLVAFE